LISGTDDALLNCHIGRGNVGAVSHKGSGGGGRAISCAAGGAARAVDILVGLSSQGVGIASLGVENNQQQTETDSFELRPHFGFF